MAATSCVFSPLATRCAVSSTAARRNVASARRTVRIVATAEKRPVVKAEVATAAAALSALAIAVAPAAQAAQEAFVLAEGEPAIVQVAWGCTAAMFSFSLAMVVWGRSGL